MFLYGEFVNGKKNGKGTLKYLEEIMSSYKEINKNLPEGYEVTPVYNPPSMVEYIGEFKDDKYQMWKSLIWKCYSQNLNIKGKGRLRQSLWPYWPYNLAQKD